MLVIRLQRKGRRNKPLYRLVVQEKKWAPSSKAIENVGTYNPHTDKDPIILKEESIKKWLSQGAQPSTTVHNMLVNAGIIKAPKMRSVQPKLKKKAEDAEAKEKKEEPKVEVKVEEKKEEEKLEEAPKEEIKPEEKPAEEKKEEEKPEEK